MSWFKTVRSTLAARLNEDLANVIIERVASERILLFLRRVMYRHVKSVKWKTLRFVLMECLPWQAFEMLQRRLWIRKEWNQEPGSWIFMMQCERVQLFYILNEVMKPPFGTVRAPPQLVTVPDVVSPDTIIPV